MAATTPEPPLQPSPWQTQWSTITWEKRLLYPWPHVMSWCHLVCARPGEALPVPHALYVGQPAAAADDTQLILDWNNYRSRHSWQFDCSNVFPYLAELSFCKYWPCVWRSHWSGEGDSCDDPPGIDQLIDTLYSNLTFYPLVLSLTCSQLTSSVV